jgi:hypothetical protein
VVQAAVMGGIETSHHHGSHRPLIWPVDESTSAVRVDAIFVPTARPVAYLKEAAAAARSLGCPLVTLHSRKWTSAYAATHYLDPTVELIAIDVPETSRLRLPELETSLLLAETMFKRRTDVSTKRNLALVLSHMLRWKRVVFLDDDIRVPNPEDLRQAAGLLGPHVAVGLGIGGFPDNSMVCHAFRDAGGWQDTFIGGGALAVDVWRNRSFFPNVYNEDWFFVLDAGKGLQSVATVGQVLQYPYDPYRVQRARAEEFGDVLAEGTFWLLDQGKPASDGDVTHWKAFLAHRKQFIEQVQDMVERRTSISPPLRTRMGEALTAAQGRLACITPRLCLDYMKAQVADQARWQGHIEQIREESQPSLEEALRALTVSGTPLTWYARKAKSAGELRTSGKSRPPAGRRLSYRRARAGELQAAIPSPPPALAPREFTPANLASSRLRSAAAAPSPTMHATETVEIAQAGQQRSADDDGHSERQPSRPVHR